jgi:hypothetical protein
MLDGLGHGIQFGWIGFHWNLDDRLVKEKTTDAPTGG